MPLTVLLTAFGPFPGAPINPTAPLVKALAGLRRPAFSDSRMVTHVFPTSYQAVDADLPRLLAQVKPDAVLMLGLSNKARCLQIETRARNAASVLTRDAAGQLLQTNCILPGGPEALSFRLPALRLACAARQASVDAVVSHDAGRYLCNYLSWRAIESMTQAQGPKLVAFVHVPQPGQQGRRMPELLRGAEAILGAALVETRRRMTKR